MSQRMNILPSEELIETPILAEDGQTLGKIEELLLDPDHGRVAYAVLSLDGLPGVGNRWFTIPWEAIERHPQTDRLQLNIERKMLLNAPDLAEEPWLEMADRRWQHEVYRYYGYRPYWEDTLHTEGQ